MNMTFEECDLVQVLMKVINSMNMTFEECDFVQISMKVKFRGMGM